VRGDGSEHEVSAARSRSRADGAGQFAEVDVVAALVPAPVEEPGAWRLDGARVGRSFEDLHEAVEPGRRREGIDDADLPFAVLDVISEQIDEGLSDLARAREVAGVEAVAPDPPALSSVDSSAFRRIENAIGRAFPRAVIVPALVLGATDGRHYQPLATGVYRFAPFICSSVQICKEVADSCCLRHSSARIAQRS